MHQKMFHLEEEEELRVQGGPSVNEVSLCTRPHRSVHSKLGIDTGATCLKGFHLDICKDFCLKINKH
jgi:hypothetical protein